jgi:uncharacterized protein YndB with AHSA1/START domain
LAENVVSVERVISAPPERIWPYVADPSKHSVIDGSGSVKGAREDARLLHLGDSFGMDMRMGVPYRMTNTVVELEENRRIAWRQETGKHVWRYELEPVDAGTRVRESFDMTTSRGAWLLRLIGAPQRNRKNMEQTLARLEAEVTARPNG